jgi:selenoprotein S
MGDVPRNEDPELLTNSFGLISNVLAEYGWFIFVAVCGSIFCWNKWGRRALEQARTRAEDGERARNPDAFREREEAMRRARERMQQEYDVKAREVNEREKEREAKREEEARLRRVEEWERLQQGRGSQSKVRVSDTAEAMTSERPKPKDNSRVLRPNDFNPLTGSGGGGACFRPGRRGPSAGGGG